jgi:Peptidase propeptide and YPEB domain
MEAVMRKLFPAAAVILLVVCAAPPGAMAQPRVDASPVSASEAQAIAADNGIVAVRRLRLDEGLWKIEGRDGVGRYVSLKIDRAAGAIVDLYRDNWW